MYLRAIATLALFLAGSLTATAQEPVNPDDVAVQIDSLLSIEDASERRRAIGHATREWAATDPIGAHATIMDQPGGTLRDEIEGSLIGSWLLTDTTGALRFVADQEEPPAYLMAASAVRGTVSDWLPVSPGSDLVEILEIADELPTVIARSVRLQTARRMAQTDPRAAARHIQKFPVDERRQAGMNVARDYASAYPDAALAWARELKELDVERAVIQAMVAADPYGMLARAVSGEEGITLPLVASGALASPNLDRSQFGAALAQLPRTTESAQAISMFTQSWLVYDQDAALEWLAGSGLELPPEAIMRAANRASGDRAFAAEFAWRLKGQNRSEWIENVGSLYGRQNPELAVEWLEQFRGDPAFPDAIANVIPQLAAADGPRAAQLIQALEGRQWLGATWTVARQWAKTDPVAAAYWADSLSGDARAPSVRAAVDQWHSYDPERAESWAMSLPQSTMREDALLSLVAAVASDGQIPPPRMFDAFGSESSRQSAILGAIGMLTVRNREAARELYATQLTDPELRQRAEELLDPPPPPPGQRIGLFGPVVTPADAD